MRPLEIFALTLFELRVQFLRARGVRPIKRIADSYRLPRNDILRGARSLPKAESKIHQPQEKLRVLLNVANRRTYLGQDQTAYSWYQQVITEYPDYPDRLAVCQKLLGLAQKLQKPEDAERWQKEITRLSAPAGSATRSS